MPSSFSAANETEHLFTVEVTLQLQTLLTTINTIEFSYDGAKLAYFKGIVEHRAES